MLKRQAPTWHRHINKENNADGWLWSYCGWVCYIPKELEQECRKKEYILMRDVDSGKLSEANIDG